MNGHNIYNGSLWGIVLAAGEGKRISRFVRDIYGLVVPKQYVAFTGKRSMLQHTLDRVERLIPTERILTVVSPNHACEIEKQLSGRPPENLIFQPYNRETAPGVLLPLIHIFKRDPEARIAIFPSDHFILEEDLFMGYIELGDWVVRRFPDKTVLFGIQPDGPETEYGWIEPAEPITEQFETGVRRVGRFMEKPDQVTAIQFFEKGYLWNSFVILAKAKTLIKMAIEHLPQIWMHFNKILEAIGTSREYLIVEGEYRHMDRATLSHGIFEKNPPNISVIEMKDLFWSDFGSGERVIESLERIGRLPLNVSERIHLRSRAYAVAEGRAVAI